MKKIFFLLIMLVVACTIAIIIITGAYPFAFMRVSANLGGTAHMLWARTANRIAETALTYYQTTLSTATTTLTITPAIKKEARQKAINALIEQVIIADAIRHMGGDADVETLLQNKFAAYAAHSNFTAAISLAYGLNNIQFIQFIARPETEKEFLKEKKGLDDAALAAWLAAEKQQTRIVQFFK